MLLIDAQVTLRNDADRDEMFVEYGRSIFVRDMMHSQDVRIEEMGRFVQTIGAISGKASIPYLRFSSLNLLD